MISQWIQNIVMPWMMESGIKVLLIVLVIVSIHFFGARIIERFVRRAVNQSHEGSAIAEKKRENTLIRILNGTIGVVIWTVAGMLVLSEVGVDIGPLLAGAGLVGVAVGFGAQYLVRDVISGLFIIIENQYRVGDIVNLANSSGEVEDITLRKTVVRDLDGAVHHIPNGEITKAINMSIGFARINMDVSVAYESDLAHVEEVINSVGEDLAKDPLWSSKIKTPPKFIRVNNFGPSSMDIKVLGDVAPQEQWAVAGELRKRFKIAFDKEGIEIPYPHQVVKRIE